MAASDRPSWLQRLRAEIVTADRLDLALRLTALCLVLRPVGGQALRPPILLLAAAALLLRRVRRSPWPWLVLTALAAVRVMINWPLADNHAFLLAYWCLAAAIALMAADPSAALARNGRLLIGFTFLFATLWKLVLSPDYMDGRFFRVTLLLDQRFTDLARLAAGLSQGQFDALVRFLTLHVDDTLPLGVDVPPQPARFVLLAQSLTFATVAIEGAIAVAFLWPLGGRVARSRDALLLLFCTTVYAIATVEGFAWLLLAMGVAQLEPGRRTMRVLYVVAFGLVLLHKQANWMRLAAWLTGV